MKNAKETQCLNSYLLVVHREECITKNIILQYNSMLSNDLYSLGNIQFFKKNFTVVLTMYKEALCICKIIFWDRPTSHNIIV